MSSLSPMRIAIICSNYFNIRKDTANGTAIFCYSFLEELARRANDDAVSVTAFASGASRVPVKLESIDEAPLCSSTKLIASGKHILYEQALISKAFSMQDQFD